MELMSHTLTGVAPPANKNLVTAVTRNLGSTMDYGLRTVELSQTSTTISNSFPLQP
jgi:hypothetical protein